MNPIEQSAYSAYHKLQHPTRRKDVTREDADMYISYQTANRIAGRLLPNEYSQSVAWAKQMYRRHTGQDYDADT